MKFKLIESDVAKKDKSKIRKNYPKSVQNKLERIIYELPTDPFYGVGKPEKLKYDLSGLWSRRLTDKERMVYEIVGQK